LARPNVQEERRRQILKALDTCLLEKSFQQTSIKDIARVAGVNHGVLHYYFASKEDILLKYIDFVIEDYQRQIREWLGAGDALRLEKREFVEQIFGFINNKITLNRNLAHIFVEIWEIALYNPAVRDRLQQAYTQWITELTQNLARHMDDREFICNVSVAMVAFWEGMALFSVIFEPREGLLRDVLQGFQRRILEIL